MESRQLTARRSHPATSICPFQDLRAVSKSGLSRAVAIAKYLGLQKRATVMTNPAEPIGSILRPPRLKKLGITLVGNDGQQTLLVRPENEFQQFSEALKDPRREFESVMQ